MLLFNFEIFNNLISHKIGISFRNDQKENLIRALKIASLWSEINSDFDNVINKLNLSTIKSDIWQKYINVIANKETFFFRESEQLLFLIKLIPANQNRTIRILSLPCSTGEEVYSLAVLLKSNDYSNYYLYGVDIRADNIEKAGRGKYDSNSFREPIPLVYRQYFEGDNINETYRYANSDSVLAIKKELLGRISFQCANLFEMQDFSDNYFDIIVCRNLLIYFNNETRLFALKKFWKLLAPGGYLALGHNDFIHEYFNALNGIDSTVGKCIYKKD
ncbi:MAG TPA: CheR family methyltransferase [Ignavibacteriaceae bacterium]|nr:CheR family methyltransferase [Ignavibacteriaceae bacterium]